MELLFGALNGSKRAECGYPKSQDEVKYLTQYLKISLDIVLDAKTFDNQVKAYLQARLQGRSRRLLREPLPVAKKRKAPPWIR